MGRKALVKKKKKKKMMIGPLLSLDPSNRDSRGLLQVIGTPKSLGCRIGAVIWMERSGGTTSGNHVHSRDSHVVFFAKGAGRYYWRPRKSGAPPAVVHFSAPCAIFTPPGVEHAFEHVTDCCCVVMANRHGSSLEYEREITRLSRSLIPPAV